MHAEYWKIFLRPLATPVRWLEASKFYNISGLEATKLAVIGPGQFGHLTDDTLLTKILNVDKEALFMNIVYL